MAFLDIFNRSERRALPRPLNPATHGWLTQPGAVSTPFTDRPLTPDLAMGHAAVWACIRVLAENIGSLPLVAYTATEDGREEAPDSKLGQLAATTPNPVQSAGELWEQVVAHICAYGNAFLYKERDASGRVIALWPIAPQRCRVGRDTSGEIIFQVIPGTGTEDTAPPADAMAVGTRRDILQIRYLTMNGLQGLSPIAVCRQSLGTHLAAEEYVGRFYKNNATPQGVLSVPDALSPEAARRLRDDWDALHAGLDNAAKTAVLEGGTTFQSIDMPLKDQEFIDQRRFSVQDIARIFGVPTYMIGEGSGDALTYSNVEQQSLHFVQFSLRPWCQRIERALENDGDLALDPNVYVQFNLDALLRADAATRWANYKDAIMAGVLSPNEIRLAENYPRQEGLDIYTFNLNPQNMAITESNTPADMGDATNLENAPPDTQPTSDGASNSETPG